MDAAYNLARWLSRSPAEADDIVQDAMLRAFRAFDAFRGGDVKPWLLTIVRNCYLTAAMERRKRVLVPITETGEAGLDTLISDSEDPETVAIGTDHARKLDRAIAQLPEEYREALILREMEDMSYRDIATVTGVPIGTVMSRLARARDALKEKWLKDIEGGCRGVQ